MSKYLNEQNIAQKGSDQNISRDIWCEMFWWRGKGRQNILNDFIGESIIMRHHKIVL